MRILQVADAHIGLRTHSVVDGRTGVNTRLLESARSVEWLLGLAEELLPDVIVLCGDETNSRQVVGSELSVLERLFRGCARIAPTIGIEGNHSAEMRGRESVTSVMARACGVSYSTRAEVVSRLGWRFLMLPYPNRAAIEAAGWTLADAARALEELIATHATEGGDLVCVGHFTVAGSRYSPEAQPVIQSGLDFTLHPSAFAHDSISAVLMGHIHNAQTLKGGLITYAGSLSTLTFGSKHDELKGVQLVEVNAAGKRPTIRRYENPHSPRFLTLDADTVTSEGTIPAGAYVRYTASRTLRDSERTMLAGMVKDAGAFMCGLIERPDKQLRTGTRSVAQEVTDEGIVAAYCKAQECDHAASSLLQLMAEADAVTRDA